MANDSLKIVETHPESNESKRRWDSKRSKREELQARLERQWLISPHQFDALRNSMERERLRRSFELLHAFCPITQQQIVDLGSAWGDFSSILHDKGGKILCVDLASNSFKSLKERYPHLTDIKQDYVPKTTLDDEKYDIVVALDIIGFIHPDDHRMFFAELSRLVKPNGFVLCSTPLDIRTEDPLQAFADLAETEFKISKWSLSYHLCYLYIVDFFSAPAKFWKASKDREYRQEELRQRKGLSQFWFRANSSPLISWFWKGVELLFNPLNHFLKMHPRPLLFLEKFCRTFWDSSGVSHAIFIGQRRPLVIPSEVPKEPKHKKEVWE